MLWVMLYRLGDLLYKIPGYIVIRFFYTVCWLVMPPKTFKKYVKKFQELFCSVGLHDWVFKRGSDFGHSYKCTMPGCKGYKFYYNYGPF